MNFESFLLFLAVVLVTTAAYYDFKWRRIPNYITFPSIVLGVVFNLIFLGVNDFKISIFGLLVGGGFFLILYLMGGMGAGDVKLAGGVGALLGMDKIITVIIITIFVGGFMALIKIGLNYSHNLKSNKNSDDYADKRDKLTKNATIKSSKETIPYGVAIAIGTIITILCNLR